MQDLLVVCSLLLHIYTVLADYECMCNYNVENAVYPEPNTQSSPLGYMYEFDCKPMVQTSEVTDQWFVIAFEHKVGYVRKDAQTEEQICAGLPPETDQLPTTASSTTTTKMDATTTSSTTNSAKTTSNSVTTSTPLPTTSTTSSTSSTPSPSPSTVLPSSSTAASTQSSTVSTTPSTAASTTAPNSTPLAMNITSTTTLPLSTGRTVSVPLLTGDTSLCPADLHRYTQEDKGALTQYGDYCYELVPIRGTWERAERDCVYKGGYLIHINNQQLQNYIYRWIKSYQFDHACWIGLHDLWQEESFEWISGDTITYTNWYSDRYGNLASHHNEDCVLLVPYAPYYGKWDDVVCGQETVYGTIGQQNPFICEFRIHGRLSAPLVG